LFIFGYVTKHATYFLTKIRN